MVCVENLSHTLLDRRQCTQSKLFLKLCSSESPNTLASTNLHREKHGMCRDTVRCAYGVDSRMQRLGPQVDSDAAT